MAVGSCWAWTKTPKATTITAEIAEHVEQKPLGVPCVLCVSRGWTGMLLIRFLLPRFDTLLVVLLVDVEEADPGEAHLVDRPLPVADPVARVRVVLVCRRVVVPR